MTGSRALDPGGAFFRWLGNHRGLWMLLVWLPVFLAWPAIGLIGDRSIVALAAWAGILATALAFAAAVIRFDRPRNSANIWLLVPLAVVAVAVSVAFGWSFGFPLLAIAVVVGLKGEWVLPAIVIISIAAGVLFGTGGIQTGITVAVTTFLVGLGNFVVQRLAEVVAELTRTRELLAEAAVTEERLRFSRDLHDIVGHTLSVIVVKAETARRLASSDPEAAATHAGEIETIGRDALREVRAAVTDYRSTGLESELEHARRALAAGGVEASIESPAGGLPEPASSVLGWVVREGATNVLRHSGADMCTIRVVTDHRVSRVEVWDDGPGGGPIVEGSGLTGLRERLERVAGTLTFERTSRGFRLVAEVPAT